MIICCVALGESWYMKKIVVYSIGVALLFATDSFALKKYVPQKEQKEKEEKETKAQAEARERAEAARKAAAAERERKAALAAQEVADRAEAKRIADEDRARVAAEQERVRQAQARRRQEAADKVEADRLAAEQQAQANREAEAKRLADEAKVAKEQADRDEADRLAREQQARANREAEAKRLADEARVAKEKADRDEAEREAADLAFEKETEAAMKASLAQVEADTKAREERAQKVKAAQEAAELKAQQEAEAKEKRDEDERKRLAALTKEEQEAEAKAKEDERFSFLRFPPAPSVAQRTEEEKKQKEAKEKEVKEKEVKETESTYEADQRHVAASSTIAASARLQQQATGGAEKVSKEELRQRVARAKQEELPASDIKKFGLASSIRPILGYPVPEAISELATPGEIAEFVASQDLGKTPEKKAEGLAKPEVVERSLDFFTQLRKTLSAQQEKEAEKPKALRKWLDDKQYSDNDIVRLGVGYKTLAEISGLEDKAFSCVIKKLKIRSIDPDLLSELWAGWMTQDCDIQEYQQIYDCCQEEVISDSAVNRILQGTIDRLLAMVGVYNLFKTAKPFVVQYLAQQSSIYKRVTDAVQERKIPVSEDLEKFTQKDFDLLQGKKAETDSLNMAYNDLKGLYNESRPVYTRYLKVFTDLGTLREAFQGFKGTLVPARLQFNVYTDIIYPRSRTQGGWGDPVLPLINQRLQALCRGQQVEESLVGMGICLYVLEAYGAQGVEKLYAAADSSYKTFLFGNQGVLVAAEPATILPAGLINVLFDRYSDVFSEIAEFKIETLRAFCAFLLDNGGRGLWFRCSAKSLYHYTNIIFENLVTSPAQGAIANLADERNFKSAFNGSFSVSWDDEQGIDATGLSRTFATLVTNVFFNGGNSALMTEKAKAEEEEREKKEKLGDSLERFFVANPARRYRMPVDISSYIAEGEQTPPSTEAVRKATQEAITDLALIEKLAAEIKALDAEIAEIAKINDPIEKQLGEIDTRIGKLDKEIEQGGDGVKAAQEEKEKLEKQSEELVNKKVPGKRQKEALRDGKKREQARALKALEECRKIMNFEAVNTRNKAMASAHKKAFTALGRVLLLSMLNRLPIKVPVPQVFFLRLLGRLPSGDKAVDWRALLWNYDTSFFKQKKEFSGDDAEDFVVIQQMMGLYDQDAKPARSLEAIASEFSMYPEGTSHEEKTKIALAADDFRGSMQGVVRSLMREEKAADYQLDVVRRRLGALENRWLFFNVFRKMTPQDCLYKLFATKIRPDDIKMAYDGNDTDLTRLCVECIDEFIASLSDVDEKTAQNALENFVEFFSAARAYDGMPLTIHFMPYAAQDFSQHTCFRKVDWNPLITLSQLFPAKPKIPQEEYQRESEWKTQAAQVNQWIDDKQWRRVASYVCDARNVKIRNQFKAYVKLVIREWKGERYNAG
jgi:hypothetical protein